MFETGIALHGPVFGLMQPIDGISPEAGTECQKLVAGPHPVGLHVVADQMHDLEFNTFELRK